MDNSIWCKKMSCIVSMLFKVHRMSDLCASGGVVFVFGIRVVMKMDISGSTIECTVVDGKFPRSLEEGGWSGSYICVKRRSNDIIIGAQADWVWNGFGFIGKSQWGWRRKRATEWPWYFFHRVCVTSLRQVSTTFTGTANLFWLLWYTYSLAIRSWQELVGGICRITGR